jgi:IclR family pca regulon transcriptional regulator
MTERGQTIKGRTAAPSDGLAKSLIKGLAILECFTPATPVLGIAEIADQLGMSRSTTHRYACTMVHLGYLEQDAKRRYRLGLRAADLGMSAIAAVDLRRQARPCLQELRGRSSGTVSLGVLDGEAIVCLDRLPGRLRAADDTITPLGAGSRIPVHASAMGKLLVALLEPGERGRLLGAIELRKLTAQTITSRRVLRAELEQIRRSAIALEDQELLDGVRSIAVPIHTLQEEALAALELSMPASAYTAQRLIAEWSEPLRHAAASISAASWTRRPRERVRPSRVRPPRRAR